MIIIKNLCIIWKKEFLNEKLYKSILIYILIYIFLQYLYINLLLTFFFFSYLSKMFS